MTADLRTTHSRLRSALVLVGLALFFALLFGAQNYYSAITYGPPTSLGAIAKGALPRWLLYAALAPAVGWLAHRWPIERKRLPLRLALHVSAAALFVVVQTIGMTLLFRLLHVYPRKDSIGEAFQRILTGFSGMNFLIYFGISGAYHALRFYREMRDRDVQAAELRTRLTEARLDALRSQLNPHFLFNTLNATSALALTGEREQVVETLSALSDLLRVSLDRDLPQEIPLERELGILASYLEIQRVRFGERLETVLDIDPAGRRALVPAMALQPLVENALVHGIETRPGPGRVTIAARVVTDALRVRVEDNGPGFAPASLAARNGIGLSNTMARLEQLYGREAQVRCGNRDDGGAFVELTLPLRYAETA